jgi:hypothetical protein
MRQPGASRGRFRRRPEPCEHPAVAIRDVAGGVCPTRAQSYTTRFLLLDRSGSQSGGYARLQTGR